MGWVEDFIASHRCEHRFIKAVFNASEAWAECDSCGEVLPQFHVSAIWNGNVVTLKMSKAGGDALFYP